MDPTRTDYIPKHLLGSLDSEGVPTDYSIEVYGLKYARKLMLAVDQPQCTVDEWVSGKKQELLCLIDELARYQTLESSYRISAKIIRPILLHSYRPADYRHFGCPMMIRVFINFIISMCVSYNESPFSCESGYACFRIVALGLGVCLIREGQDLGFREARNLTSFRGLDLHAMSLHINSVVYKWVSAMDHIADFEEGIIGWSGDQQTRMVSPLSR
ncbi:unnamed protein product [Rhizoctonia solani]|uniref:Uncharacterized protein n=1 Tax=Rhizoctonia solani TaxID=456999 RepID=A0A8H3C5M3_9AGAM|nr:unnamed protein product [Rhizoctonia solani]